MYGLPKDFHPNSLVGRTLEQVCFSQNQLILVFDANVQITIESLFSHEAPGLVTKDPIDFPIGNSELMQVLEHAIVEALGDAKGTLTLRFDNGHTIKCFDPYRQYEAYRIQIGETEIII
jgi:hypothetical protein